MTGNVEIRTSRRPRTDAGALALLRAAVLCLFVGACGRDLDRETTWAGSVETLSNGATLVRNPETGLWAEGEGWRLVEDLRIGALDGSGPNVFGNTTSLSIAVDDEGRIFVLDGQSQEVRVFDAAGTHVTTFGRSGAGPGEMLRPALAGWGAEGNLWIVDPGNARYSVFSPAGEFLASHRRDLTFIMTPWPGTIDAEGRIIDVDVRRGERSGTVLVRVEPTTSARDTFPIPTYDGGWFHLLNAAGQPMRSVTIPFAGRLISKPDANGFVWSAIAHLRADTGAGPAYDLFDASGRFLGEVPTTTSLILWHPRPVFRGDHVYGFALDDMLVPHLVRQRVEKPGRGGNLEF